MRTRLFIALLLIPMLAFAVYTLSCSSRFRIAEKRGNAQNTLKDLNHRCSLIFYGCADILNHLIRLIRCEYFFQRFHSFS